MAKIGFIGLGQMGLPMAKNLKKAGYAVKGYDASKAALAEAEKAGIVPAKSVAEAATEVDIVISMVPEGERARAVYFNDDGVLKNAAPGTLLIDCSNIYAATTHQIHEAAEEAGFQILDAPVAGGVEGAKAGKLTFMVRGDDKAFLEGEPVLKPMAERVFHYGPTGKQSKKQTADESAQVIYKKTPKWKGAAIVLIALFLGGNAVFYALIEDSIQIVNGRLTLTLELGATEQKIFCRGSKLIGLKISGC